MKNIDSKLSEYSGHENLEIMSETWRFNNWMYDEIFPAIKGDILEIGSGLGTFSEKIFRDFPKSHIVLTDISLSYGNELKKKFSSNNVSIFKLDLNMEEDYRKIGYGKFDSIIALNVLEHVEKDEFALLRLYDMLRHDGTLILLVPANKFLFNAIDKEIGHFRRYSRGDLELKIKKTQFKIDKMFHFNILGIVGWYINGSLTKSSTVNRQAIRIFDKMVPLSRFSEKILMKKIGLSLICYLRK